MGGTVGPAPYEGNNGSYGSPTYKVYFYDEPSASYAENEAFSALTMSLGIFEVDEQKNMLFVGARSGATWFQRSGYRIVDNVPILAYEKTEEYLPDGQLQTTEKTMKNGEWVTETHTTEE